MTDLDAVENDADGNFWYDPIGSSVRPCSADPAPTLVSTGKKHWVEIALVDEESNPCSGRAYKIQLPNGSVLTGTLDSRGLARINGIDPGTCKVSFPELDKSSWR